MNADFRTTLTDSIISNLSAWEKVQQDRDLGGIALSGHPFVVAQADCSMALRIEGCAAIPVMATPSACGGILGSTQMTRENAERIAALRGDGYVVVPVREIADRRIAALRESLEMLRQLS